MKIKSVISTRTKTDNFGLKKILSKKGILVLDLPMIRIDPIAPRPGLKDYIFKIDHLLFTSRNGVKYFLRQLKQNEIRQLKNISVHCIGLSTAKAFVSCKVKNISVIKKSTGIGMIRHIRKKIKGDLLYVTGAFTDNTMMQNLHKIPGIFPRRLNVYNTKEVASHDVSVTRNVHSDNYGIILFASPSSVDNFIKSIYKGPKDHIGSPKPLRTATFGPKTKKALASHGINPVLELEYPGMENMVESLISFFKVDSK